MQHKAKKEAGTITNDAPIENTGLQFASWTGDNALHVSVTNLNADARLNKPHNNVAEAIYSTAMAQILILDDPKQAG